MKTTLLLLFLLTVVGYSQYPTGTEIRNRKLLERVEQAEKDREFDRAATEYRLNQAIAAEKALALKKQLQESNKMYWRMETARIWAKPNPPVNQDALWKFRFQQASNGFPAFQYDVGTNYLAKQDTNTAIFWLEKASKQGHIGASNALKQVKK